MAFYQKSLLSKQAFQDSDQLPLSLAIEDAPPKVRQHGLQEAHAFPLVSHGKSRASVRRPAPIAWHWEEIELRTPNSFPALILDVDKTPLEYPTVALGVEVRVPNWVVSNPETGHGHIVYTLRRPVLRGDRMRLAPFQKLARVAEYYGHAYSADRGHMGFLMHNPTHVKWGMRWLREES